MNPAAALRELSSPAGQAALAAALAVQPREADFLSHFQRLNRQHPAHLARLALEIAILRGEARAKFPFADQLYFTRPALEQASPWEVARQRAARFAGFARLLDLGCSVGMDSLALAEQAPVLGFDLDPLRLGMARRNAASLGLAGRAAFIQADLRRPLPVAARRQPAAGAFFDPARRSAGRRIFSVQAYQPPLDTIWNWLPAIPALAVKLSPGVDLAELAPYPAELEFVSLGGELKEAVLWFGDLRGAARRATVLPAGASLSADDPARLPELPLSAPQAWLCEPDPAVLRAGLVTLLGAQLGAAQLDADIAYLTLDHPPQTPFGRAWQVEAWLPFQLKRLRAYLRERRVGRLTVKKRGSPLQPEALIRDLRLSGDEERVLFLTHLRGAPIAILAFPNLPG